MYDGIFVQKTAVPSTFVSLRGIVFFDLIPDVTPQSRVIKLLSRCCRAILWQRGKVSRLKLNKMSTTETDLFRFLNRV